MSIKLSVYSFDLRQSHTKTNTTRSSRVQQPAALVAVILLVTTKSNPP